MQVTWSVSCTACLKQKDFKKKEKKRQPKWEASDVFLQQRPACVVWHTIKGLAHVFLGTKRNLQCVNDYLTTINCSLSGFNPDGNCSYTLNITETIEKWESYRMIRIAGKQYRVLARTPNCPLFFYFCAEQNMGANWERQAGYTSAQSEYTNRNQVFPTCLTI